MKTLKKNGVLNHVYKAKRLPVALLLLVQKWLWFLWLGLGASQNCDQGENYAGPG